MITLYNKIENAIRNFSDAIPVDVGTTEDDVRYAIRWVMRDNPDIFWFVHQYQYDSDTSLVSFSYQFSSKKVELLKKSINEVVEKDFQLDYVRSLNQIEQVAYVYKWLLNYCNYNINSAFNQNIDSVFVRRNSVCTGYSKAALYLFKLLGIESRLVFGKLNNDVENGRHCWNLVKIDDIYYNLDISLGDAKFDESLFCVSTDEIAKTRTIEDVEILPKCQQSLAMSFVEQLLKIETKHRDGDLGCLLAAFGSSADIHLCVSDKHLVLKKFRNKDKCAEEFKYMQKLSGCRHLIQLDKNHSDVENGILAIEQSTPLVDLLCSHYYKMTMKSLLTMICDIAQAWLECKERGVLYRDIHICNIYRSNDGIYKLGDFGSCTDDFSKKEVVGNQWFMAPETYAYGVFDERSAVYSITMVLYFILNGLCPAFIPQETEEQALMMRMKGAILPNPMLLNEQTMLKWLVDAGCACNANSRIANCQALADALRQYSEEVDNFVISLNNAMWFDVKGDFKLPLYRSEAFHKTAWGDEIESWCTTMGGVMGNQSFKSYKENCSYEPKVEKPRVRSNNGGLFSRLFAKSKPCDVFSSIFAPAEIAPGSNMLVQVYLHQAEDAKTVKMLARESQKDAERRDYIPLQCTLKKGDKVDVQLNIYGDKLLMTETKQVTWRGSLTKCSFDYFVPWDLNIYNLSCSAILSVNGAMVGEMRFVTEVVAQPRSLNPEVMAHKYNKIFISYAHEDEDKVGFMAKAYKAQGVDYFFDRDYLKAGDIFPIKIKEYINSADLFVLCWSANAAKSRYVQIERTMALKRAYPQVQPFESAPLFIYPISIEPRVDLPPDMRDYYNFDIL